MDEVRRSGRAGDVASESAAARALQGHMRARRGRADHGVALDRPGARGTTERLPVSITRDQVKRLRRIVRVRTWLPHAPSKMSPSGPLLAPRHRIVTVKWAKSKCSSGLHESGEPRRRQPLLERPSTEPRRSPRTDAPSTDGKVPSSSTVRAAWRFRAAGWRPSRQIRSSAVIRGRSAGSPVVRSMPEAPR